MAFLDRKGLAGHCVIRRNPWHFLGIYATRGEAEYQAKYAGGDYEVVFGTHPEGTDDFVASGHHHSAHDRLPAASERE